MNKVIYVSDEDKKYWDKLEKIAEKEERSVSYYVNKMVKKFTKGDE